MSRQAVQSLGVIKNFLDRETQKFWNTGKSRRFPNDIYKRAFRKLQLIHAAPDLDFLRFPPGNNLEKLSGDRQNFYSIRINRQWRICFRWDGEHACDVEIVDYH